MADDFVGRLFGDDAEPRLRPRQPPPRSRGISARGFRRKKPAASPRSRRCRRNTAESDQCRRHGRNSPGTRPAALRQCGGGRVPSAQQNGFAKPTPPSGGGAMSMHQLALSPSLQGDPRGRISAFQRRRNENGVAARSRRLLVPRPASTTSSIAAPTATAPAVAQWLTGWLVTAEAVGRIDARRAGYLVSRSARQPWRCWRARRAAPAEVAWGGGCVDCRRHAGALEHPEQRAAGYIGVIGPMTFERQQRAADRAGTARRSISTAAMAGCAEDQVRYEELDWMRIGAALDRSRHDPDYRDGLRPGLSSSAISPDLVERCNVALGGINHHPLYRRPAPMAAPRLGVPMQFAANRNVGGARRCRGRRESLPFWDIPARCCTQFYGGRRARRRSHADPHAVADLAFDAVAAVPQATAPCCNRSSTPRA